MTVPNSITKKQLITVLNKEPLFPGKWINPDIKKGKTCTVCAVGSVIRGILRNQPLEANDAEDIFGEIANNMTSYYMSNDDFEDQLIKNKTEIKAFKAIIIRHGHWSALSSYFEYRGSELLNKMMDLQCEDLSDTEFLKEQKHLVKRCKDEVVPKLVNMVEKYFPEVIPLPSEKIEDSISYHFPKHKSK